MDLKGKAVEAVFVSGHPDPDGLKKLLSSLSDKIQMAKDKGFECIKFERADTKGDTSLFDDYRAKGLMDEMENHYQMTKPVFGEYKTYPKWKEDTDIPIPDEDFDEVVDDIVDKAEAGELCMDCNLDKCVCGIVDGNDKNKERITIKTKEWYKENIEGKVGTLMFPSDWREIQVCDLDAKVYSKMRKIYKFSGRIKMFCHTGLDKTAEQNTMIKYKYPHCSESDWNGAYQEDGNWVSDYVYGEVVVVV